MSGDIGDRRARTFLVTAVIALGLFGSTKSAAALDCTDWNTNRFFEVATANYVAACLESGVDPNARSEHTKITPLHRAALFSWDPKIVWELLWYRAEWWARNHLGATPLHWAAGGNWNPEVVSTLLDAGADIGALDGSGRTPLHMAAMYSGNPDVVELLLDYGADPSARDKDDKIPLDYARENDALMGSDAYLMLQEWS